MKYNKFVAPVMAGVLSLTLGLAACSSGSSEKTTTDSTKTEETAKTDTTKTDEAAKTTTDSTAATTEKTEADANKTIFWGGTTDQGDSVLYSEEAADGTASLLIFGTHNDEVELLAYDGKMTVDGTKETITNADSGESFTFEIVEKAETSMTFNMGEHGTGTLQPVTQKEFDAEVDNVLKTLQQAGEQLGSMSDQQIEELLTTVSLMAEF